MSRCPWHGSKSKYRTSECTREGVFNSNLGSQGIRKGFAMEVMPEAESTEKLLERDWREKARGGFLRAGEQ